MTSHELAKWLLDQPNLPVKTGGARGDIAPIKRASLIDIPDGKGGLGQYVMLVAN